MTARNVKVGLRAPETWGRAVLLGVAFMALGVVSDAFSIPPQRYSLFYLPSGLLLAVFLRSPPREWSAFLLAILLFGMVEDVVIQRYSVGLAVSWSLANGLRALLGAWLMRRWLGPEVRFTRLREVGGLLLAAGVGSLASATLGVGAVAFGDSPTSFWRDWFAWWLSDTLGAVLLAPVVLTWWPGRWMPWRPSGWGEFAAALVLLAAVGTLVFGGSLPHGVVPSLPYAVLPLLLWPALRLGPRGAATASFILGLITIWYTHAGRGPFSLLPTGQLAQLLSAQLFLAVATLSALLLAALAVERRRAEVGQRLLAESGALLASALDYRLTLPRVAERLAWELGSGVLFRVERREGGVEEVARVGVSPQREEALRGGEEPLPESPRTGVGPEGTVLWVPLRGHERVLGVLALVAPRRSRAFSRDELALVEELARRCALAVETARLFAQAQEAVAVRDEFISIAAHELRTPLTALTLRMQSLERFLRRMPGSEGALSRLPPLARQISRLSTLVESLLDVGRINSGRLELRREEVELARLVEDVAERFAELGQRAGCTLRLQLEEGIIGWYDRLRVEQVLLNLLSNALKFGPGRPIDIELRREGEKALLTVRDRGIGIEAEALERIFGRFERAVSAREYGGLGLGLFLARQIAEAHGGRLRVSSRAGEGASFTLELPRGQPKAGGVYTGSSQGVPSQDR